MNTNAPDGDPGVIFDHAVTLLRERVENKKLGSRRGRGHARPSVARRIT